MYNYMRILSDSNVTTNSTPIDPHEEAHSEHGSANWTLFIIIAFVLGYAGIILEHLIHLNKSISAIIMAVFCWTFLF